MSHKDMMGNDINVGDLVVYATSNQLMFGQVTKLTYGKFNTVYRDGKTVPKIQVKTVSLSGPSWQLTTFQFLDKVLVINGVPTPKVWQEALEKAGYGRANYNPEDKRQWWTELQNLRND